MNKLSTTEIIAYMNYNMEMIRTEMIEAYEQCDIFALKNISTKIKNFTIEITDILYQAELSINTQRFLTLDKKLEKELEEILRNVHFGSNDFLKSITDLEKIINDFITEYESKNFP